MIDYEDNHPAVPDVESDNKPRWSGLYDATGQKLYQPRNPVGFHIDKRPDRRTLS